MSKLICEVCESTDFMKQESMFVCQSCGLKYSVAEVKKMMSGGADGTMGNVAVGNTAKLDNLFQLARRARDENNTEKAAQYYEQILPADPNSWEAMFYSTYYAAIQKWRNDDKGSALASLKNCIGHVIDIINDIGEYIAVAEITTRLSDICSVFYGANGENFESFLRQYRAAGMSDYNRQVFQQYLRQTSAIHISIAQIYYVLGVKVLEIANDKNCLDSIVEKAMDLATRVADGNPCDDAFEFYSGYTYNYPEVSSIRLGARDEAKTLKESCNNVRKLMKEKQEALAKQQFNEYWNSHQTEKAALESEKQSLTQQIAALNKKLSETDSYVRMVELQKKVKYLISEKSALDGFTGLFKGKEKKAIQNQIDAVNAELARFQAWANNAKTQHISPLESRINAINTELTKPR
jgi:hypothetical protein